MFINLQRVSPKPKFTFKLLYCLLVLVLIFVLTIIFQTGIEERVVYADAPLNERIKLIVFGRQLTTDVPPVLERGRVLLPLRAIAETLGAAVSWDEATGMVGMNKDAIRISLRINESVAFVNDRQISLDVPAQVRKGRTIVPLRFISEAFGYEVKWNKDTRTVTVITTVDKPPGKTEQPVPPTAGELTKVLFITAGMDHNLILTTDGTVLAWGRNTYGQMGNGEMSGRNNNPVQVLNLTNVIDVSGGRDHSLALREDGTVWGWGRNYNGQVGVEQPLNIHTPVQVRQLSDVTDISANGEHSLAVRRDGTVWAWGNNAYGQLGDGTTIARNAPVQVTGLTDVAAVSAGATYSLALLRDGTVRSWGDNRNGQLGDGRSAEFRFTPVPVAVLTDVVAISGGGGANIALRRDGTIWTWGKNWRGQLGDGTVVAHSHFPVRVPALTGIKDISAGSMHIIALRGDGTVWSWGWNNIGQLGEGTTIIDRHEPVRVKDLTDIIAIAAGGKHGIALRADGTLWTWGSNRSGQLGDEVVVVSTVPIKGPDLNTK